MQAWMQAALASRVLATPPAKRARYAFALTEEWIPEPHPSTQSAIVAAEILFKCGASFCPRCKTFRLVEPYADERIKLCGHCAGTV